MGSRTSFSVSQQLRSELSEKMNALNPLKLKFCKIEKEEDTLIILLSAWDRSRDSTAKKKPVKGHVQDLGQNFQKWFEL